MDKVIEFKRPADRLYFVDLFKSEFDRTLADLGLNDDQVKKASAAFEQILKLFDFHSYTRLLKKPFETEDAHDIGRAFYSSFEVLDAALGLCGRIVQLEEEFVELKRQALKKV